jgi:hypothetical protein
MRKRSNRMFIALVVATLFAVGPVAGGAFAQDNATAPKGQKGLSQAQVKQLLELMDTDKSGKISKQEWMNFMSAEFDRLDTDKSGELDVKELSQSRLQASSFPKFAGK